MNDCESVDLGRLMILTSNIVFSRKPENVDHIFLVNIFFYHILLCVEKDLSNDPEACGIYLKMTLTLIAARWHPFSDVVVFVTR